jgi:hypothetical protein
VLFAPVLLVAGCAHLSYGIAAIAGSHVFTVNAHCVFGNLRSSALITLIIGVLQLLAAAVAVPGLNVLGQMLVISACPACPLMIVVVDVVALYGLCADGSRAHLEAV